MTTDKNGSRSHEMNPRAWTEAILRRIVGIRRMMDVLTDEVDQLGALMLHYTHGDTRHHDQREREPGPEAPSGPAPQEEARPQGTPVSFKNAPWRRK